MLSDILNSISNAKGTKEKIAVLHDNATNAYLQDILTNTYSPQRNFGVVAISPKTTGSKRLEDIMVRMNRYQNRGDDAVKELTDIAESLMPDDQKYFLLMLRGNLRIGLQSTSINKVYGFEMIWDSGEHYMRCSLPTEKLVKAFKWEDAIVQEKFDGAYHELGDFGLRTRNGNIYPRTTNPFFNMMPHIDGIVMGEILVLDQNGVMPREKSNGIVNSMMQGTPLDTTQYQIEFHIWDWRKNDTGACEIPYTERLKKAELLAQYDPRIKIVESRTVQSLQEAKDIALDFVRAGKEGAIVKEAAAYWQAGTSKSLLKLKIECDADLRAVEFVEGDSMGKHADTFGSIKCRSEDGLLEVDISGFTDDQRQRYSANPDLILDKIVTVKFNSILKKDGQPASLFLPRIAKDENGVIIRDKTVADTLERIEEIFQTASTISGL